MYVNLAQKAMPYYQAQKRKHTHSARCDGRFTQRLMRLWLMVMMMTWHLAGHAHRWWTPSDFTGSLHRVRFGAEAWHSCCVLRNRKFRGKRREWGRRKKKLWPHRLTEQMFSPPPSLTAKHMMTKPDCGGKLVQVWTWLTAVQWLQLVCDCANQTEPWSR